MKNLLFSALIRMIISATGAAVLLCPGSSLGASKNKTSEFEVMVTNLLKGIDTPTLTVEQLQTMDLSKLIILDAREKEEFDVSHIKGAINVGYDDFDLEKATTKIKALIKKKATTKQETKIIVYCSVGYRSGKIAQMLNNKGLKSFNLFGGIFQWHNDKNPVFDNTEKAVNRVHTYSSSWGKWLLRGEKVN